MAIDLNDEKLKRALQNLSVKVKKQGELITEVVGSLEQRVQALEDNFYYGLFIVKVVLLPSMVLCLGLVARYMLKGKNSADQTIS